MSILGEGLEILGLIDKAKNADVYRHLGDYIDKVRELQLENEHLSERLKEVERQLEFKGKIERIKGHVFVEGDDEEICPRCAEVDRKPVHLMVLRVPQDGFRLCCPQCNLKTHRHVPLKRADAQAKTD
jgi:regulator of replication initiation timing